MKYSKVGAAVALALAASSAYAIPPATVGAVANRLTVAGASAARDSFILAVLDPTEGICASAIDIYRATPTSGQDFRAYTCHLKTLASLGSVSNTDVVIFYRSEGGSAWGPVSIATNTQVMRLNPGPACVAATAPISGFTTWDCPVTGYAISTDTGTGAIVKDTVELGVSDVEPKLFQATNYPSPNPTTVFPAFNGTVAANLRGLAYTTGYSQIFGVILNTTGSGSSAVNNLSKQDVQAIFTGAYSDWSQVPRQDNSGFYPAGEIIVCRREPGSGTQASAAQYFLGVGCGAPSRTFITDSVAGLGDRVQENSTTSGEEACVNSNANAIGINVLKTTPISGAANVKYVSIDGVAPSVQAAALGQYQEFYELAFTKRPGLTGTDNALADGIISVSRNAATVPTNPSTFAIPGAGAANIPNVPISTADPVGLGTRSGDSCRPAVGL